MTPIVAILVASLLGSAHCAAMCSGFVCLYASPSGGAREPGAPARRGRELDLHALYHAGRLFAYVTLGVIAGAIGAGVDRVGTLAGFARAASIVGGAMLVLWGLGRLAALRGIALPSVVSTRTGRALRMLLGAGRTLSPRPRALLIGTASAMLPCGWLWAFVATAAATGSAARGGLAMGAFWLGTVPALAATASGVRLAFGPLRHRLPELAAVLVVVLGALSIAGRFVPTLQATHGAHASPSMHATARRP